VSDSEDLTVGFVTLFCVFTVFTVVALQNTMWNDYDDGYIFPGESSSLDPEWQLCKCAKCAKLCDGGKKILKRTWSRHHETLSSRPSRRAIPTPLESIGSAAAHKESRPRSDSDEITARPAFETQVSVSRSIQVI
jgi:hypothetical protein